MPANVTMKPGIPSDDPEALESSDQDAHDEGGDDANHQG